MLSSDLMEVRLIGEEVKRVATEELPTLVKYADPIAYLPELSQFSRAEAKKVAPREGEPFQLISIDKNGENQILAALLYRYGNSGYAENLDYVENLSEAERSNLVDKLFEDVGKFDIPMRELEYANLSLI